MGYELLEMRHRRKFFVGDEYSGLHYDKLDWITKTFSKDSYEYVDEGYMYYCQFVIFKEDKDALLYRLRWG